MGKITPNYEIETSITVAPTQVNPPVAPIISVPAIQQEAYDTYPIMTKILTDANVDLNSVSVDIQQVFQFMHNSSPDAQRDVAQKLLQNINPMPGGGPLPRPIQFLSQANAAANVMPTVNLDEPVYNPFGTTNNSQYTSLFQNLVLGWLNGGTLGVFNALQTSTPVITPLYK